MVLFDVEVICAWQIGSARKLEGKIGVIESCEDVRDDGLLINVHAEHLSLFVDADDTVGCLVVGGDKDGFTGDAVHVHANAGFKVVKVDEAILCNEVDDAVLLRDLHGDREVVSCLGREVNVDVLLSVWSIGRLVINFDDVELRRILGNGRNSTKYRGTNLRTRSSPDRKCKQLRRLLVPIKLDFGERCSVAFYGLTDAPFSAVELHGPLNFEGGGIGCVSGDANENQPLFVGSRAVVDNLCAGKGSMAVENLLRAGCGVADGPVENGGLRHKADGSFGNPFPENDVLVAVVRFNLLLRFNVKDLQCSLG